MSKFDFIFFDSGGTLYQAGIKGENSPSKIYENRVQRIHPLLLQFGYTNTPEDLLKTLEYVEDVCTKKFQSNLFNFAEVIIELCNELNLVIPKEYCFLLADLYAGPRFKEWLFPETLNAIKQLEQLGIKMGIIANTEWPGFSMDRAFSAIGLLPYLKYRVYSGDIQLKKPDIKIFKYAENLAGAQGKRVLYVGNDLNNDILPPKKIGWYSAFRMPQANYQNIPLADFQFYNILDLVNYCKD